MAENKKLVPKRRFKGFSGEWEQRKLGDISDVTKLAGFEFTEYVVYSDEGEIIALRGLNVKNGKLVLDNVKYIDKSDFSKLNRSKLFIGDILLTYVGTVGELAVISENNRFYLAPNVARIRLVNEYNAQFTIQQMRSKNFYDNMIFPLIATSSQPALSMENVRKFKLSYPEKDEQTKIGTFFSHLDNLITLQQRKLEKTKALKSAYLSEMFPQDGESVPKRRFKGFSGDWEKRKLVEVSESYSGGTPTVGVKEYYGGQIPFIRSAEINSNNTELFITEVGLNNSSARLVTKGDILYALYGATSGEVGRARLKGSINQAILAIKPHPDYDAEYIAQWLRKSKQKIIETYLQGGQGNLSGAIVKGFMIEFASLKEQTKIGQFFSHLDNLITQQQRKLEKLKDIKKAYLNEMFI